MARSGVLSAAAAAVVLSLAVGCAGGGGSEGGANAQSGDGAKSSVLREHFKTLSRRAGADERVAQNGPYTSQISPPSCSNPITQGFEMLSKDRPHRGDGI
jgi:hypothetical protein